MQFNVLEGRIPVESLLALWMPLGDMKVSANLSREFFMPQRFCCWYIQVFTWLSVSVSGEWVYQIVEMQVCGILRLHSKLPWEACDMAPSLEKLSVLTSHLC
jgi:hypothetical protein